MEVVVRGVKMFPTKAHLKKRVLILQLKSSAFMILPTPPAQRTILHKSSSSSINFDRLKHHSGNVEGVTNSRLKIRRPSCKQAKTRSYYFKLAWRVIWKQLKIH